MPFEGTLDLPEIPHQLGVLLNISDFAGGILAATILMAFFLVVTLSICWYAKARDVMLPCLFIGFMSMGLSVALAWLPAWFLLIMLLVVALMFAGEMRDWITGRSR